MGVLEYIDAWRRLPPHVAPSPATAKTVITALERQFNVNLLTYNGIRIWPWLRNALIFFYSEGRGPLAAARPQVDERTAGALLHKARNWLHRYEQDEFGAGAMDKLAQRDILFVNYGAARGLRLNNVRIDPRLDPLIDCVDKQWSWAKILVDNTSKTYVPDLIEANWINHDCYLKWLDLLDRAHALTFSTPPVAIRNWETFRPLLPALVDSDGSRREVDVADVVDTMRTIEQRANYISKVLERVRPRLTVSVGKNVNTHALFLACNRANIASADVQHGAAALSPSNIKWFGWRRVPAEGYELLPNHFLVWAESAANRIRSTTNNSRRHTPVVVGDQWLTFGQKFVEGVAEDGLSILVTLTQLDVALPPPFLIKAISKAPPEWHWRVRAHPADVETPDAVSTLAKFFGDLPNVEIVESSKAPLPALLNRVQRHVTMYSSTAVEATAFGIGTIFIHEFAHEFFGWLLEMPGFAYAGSSGELIALLKAGVPTPPRLVETDPMTATRALNALLSATAPENSAAS